MVIALSFNVFTALGQYKIDGVTGASPMMDIQVDSGFCYDSFAVLYLYYSDSYDSYDRHFVMYGNDTTNFDDTTLVVNWPRNVICTLTNLIPDSDYKFRYRGELSSNPTESQYTEIGFMRTQAVLTDMQNPQVSLLAPLAGDTVYVSAQTVIKWSAKDNVGIASLIVYQSDDEGMTWDSF